MSALDALAPDQRAVVALLLGQERSYEDIAGLLGMPVEAVRRRAHAGLDALAPANGLPHEVTAPLADYLLGQQTPADASATQGLLAESAPARAWAAGVASALASDAPGALPEVPEAREARVAPPAAEEAKSPAAGEAKSAAAEEAKPPAADEAGSAAARRGDAGVVGGDEAPDAGDHAPAPSSRLGGALLILGVLAVVAVALVLVLGGDDERPTAPPAATAAPTATAAPAQVTDQIDLRAVGGSRASGRMTVYVQSGQLLFQLQARDVPPSGERTSYAVWVTGPGDRARRLGYTDPVQRDGVLAIQGPSDADLDAFPRIYATYTHVVVSRETDADARRPARPVLRGPLPRGRPG